MENRLNLKLMILSIFLVIYTLFFYISSVDKRSRVDVILQEHIHDLQIQYRLIQSYFISDANSIREAIQNNSYVVELFSRAKYASKKEQDAIRKELIEHLTPLYKRVLKKGILQFHFVFSNNITFLRMHKEDKFGDDLSDIRYSFEYVNKFQKMIYGFEQGKTVHGFRFISPIFDKEKRYIGAFDTSLSSDFIQNKLINSSKLHSHFLVKKDIFDVNSWGSKYLLENYVESMENKDYKYSPIDTINIEHKHLNEKTLLQPLIDTIAKKIALKEPFAVYGEIDNNVTVISFLPIQNIKDKKVVAYLVSYDADNNIYEILVHFKVLVITIFCGLIFLAYFIYITLKSKYMLKELASRDQLTSLYNRRYFYDVSKEILSISKREKYDISLLMIDIDKFKNFNDRYGHANGDRVLQVLALLLVDKTRDSDIVARVGGEEFVVLLPNTSESSAVKLAEKLRKFTEQQVIKIDNKRDTSCTISIGVSSVNMEEERVIEPAQIRADKALYRAKNSGRNRVCLLSP